MQEKTKHILLRIAVHILLAAFLANAANKFFVADLDYEFANGFYEKIFVGLGDAPDQYRILPLGPLKLLCGYLPFEDPNTNKLYKKIMAGDFELPRILTPLSKEMLKSILNAGFYGTRIC